MWICSLIDLPRGAHDAALLRTSEEQRGACLDRTQGADLAPTALGMSKDPEYKLVPGNIPMQTAPSTCQSGGMIEIYPWIVQDQYYLRITANELGRGLVTFDITKMMLT